MKIYINNVWQLRIVMLNNICIRRKEKILLSLIISYFLTALQFEYIIFHLFHFKKCVYGSLKCSCNIYTLYQRSALIHMN